MTNLQFIGRRFFDIFRFFPKRVERIFFHFWFFRYVKKVSNQITRPLHLVIIWSLELLILVAELFGIGEIYDIAITLFKRSAGPLSSSQLQEAIRFYGDHPIFRKVRIDEQAKIGTGKWSTAYVSCFTINTGAPIAKEVLIHELVHVIQYRKYGLRYMTRAIYGQQWGKGYNYGGIQGLLAWQTPTNQEKYFFNPEQEAEFITDLYLLSQKKEPGYFGRDLLVSDMDLEPDKVLQLNDLG